MGLYHSILGTIQSYFHIGGPQGPQLRNSSGAIQARTANNGAYAHMEVLRASGADDASTYLDLKERAFLIEFSFDGADAPDPADNTGKYGFCHTTGGGFTAGKIYFDDASTLGECTVYKTSILLSTAVVAGTVSLIANGVYTAQTGSAPFTWTLKGDGTPSFSGIIRAIKLTLSTIDVDSTTVIPTSAKIMRVYTNITSPYTADTTITVTVDAQTVQAATENDPESAGIYLNDPMLTISSGAVLHVDIVGAETGDGEVVVEYYSAFLA